MIGNFAKKSSPFKLGSFQNEAGGLSMLELKVPEDQQAEFGVSLPNSEQNAPRCCKCKTPIDRTRKARVTGKCVGSWICGTCNCRQVQLRKTDRYKEFMEVNEETNYNSPGDSRTLT